MTGQPRDYLTGVGLYLTSINKRNPASLASGPQFVGHVIVHPTAKIGSNCRIGPNVVIGPGVVVGDGVRMQRTVILDGGACGFTLTVAFNVSHHLCKQNRIHRQGPCLATLLYYWMEVNHWPMGSYGRSERPWRRRTNCRRGILHSIIRIGHG